MPPKATNPSITPALASNRSRVAALFGLEVVGEDGSLVVDVEGEPDVGIVGLAGSSWDGYRELGGLISNGSDVA
jgi:hypothetical protein